MTCRDCDHTAQEFYEFNSTKTMLMLTGTPILNKPSDLFAQLNLIDPVNFYNERYFLQDYCQQDYYTKRWRFASGGLERLTHKMSAKFVKRTRESAGVVLPPQSEQFHDLIIDPQEYPEQYAVLKTLNQHAAILLEENKAMPILYMISLILRKRQAACFPEGIILKNDEGEVIYKTECKESIKVDYLIKQNGEIGGLIPELEGENVVLFSQFKSPLKEIHKRLQVAGISSVIYDGDTPQSLRQEIQMDMDAKHTDRKDTKFKVVLCNYKTGGVGVNMTNATQMILLDSEWSPGKTDQAKARINRMGQTAETTVHIIRLKGSVDIWMDQLNEQKKLMVEGFEESIDMQQALRDAILGDTY